MNPLSEIKREQDLKFDEQFYFLVDNNDKHQEKSIKKYLASRDLAIEEAVRAEVVKKITAHSKVSTNLMDMETGAQDVGMYTRDVLEILTTSPSR